MRACKLNSYQRPIPKQHAGIYLLHVMLSVPHDFLKNLYEVSEIVDLLLDVIHVRLLFLVTTDNNREIR